MCLSITNVTDDALMAAVTLKADQIQQLADVLSSFLALGIYYLLCHNINNNLNESVEYFLVTSLYYSQSMIWA